MAFQGSANLVGVGIGVYNDCRCSRCILLKQACRRCCDGIGFVFHRIACQHHEVALLGFGVVVGEWQQLAVDVQLVFGIVVEHVQEVFWRAVVLQQVVNIAFAACFQQAQHFYFCTHKRENGLLFVAEIHHHRVVVSHQQVDYGELHGVQILHLVYLNPLVFAVCGTCSVYIIGVEQQVLEVQHCVFLLVFGKEFGVVHFGYECPNAFCHLSVDVRRVGFVGILHCVVVYFQYRLLVVGLALRVANVLDGFAVVVGKALWVKEILPFVAMLHLEHKVRKKNYLLVFLLPFVVVHYSVFALLPVFGNDADGFFVVDDGRVGRYFPLFKQEFGAEMVHVSYLQTACVVVFHHRANTVQHFACCTIGERKAQHISVFQSLLPCVAYALGKNMSLSAPW